MRLSDFKALTFDCYGTLIDWEAGILNELKPWAEKNGLKLTDDQILETFAEIESATAQDNPANEVGLTSAWIDRRAGKQGQGATKKLPNLPKVHFKFNTLGEFAAAHNAEQKL